MEPYELVSGIGISDEKVDCRRGVLNKEQRRMAANMLKASEENNPAEAISWQRSQLMMNKLLSLPYSGNEGVILPMFTKFQDHGKISKITIRNKKKEKKIEKKVRKSTKNKKIVNKGENELAEIDETDYAKLAKDVRAKIRDHLRELLQK